MEALSRYRWKGNIRELRNTVERMMIMAPGDTVDVSDLPGAVRTPGASSAPLGNRGAVAASSGAAPVAETVAPGTLREFKDNAERAFLVQKLRENAWNISKTAEVIDTPRSNLYKKLEQYQISQESDG